MSTRVDDASGSTPVAPSYVLSPQKMPMSCVAPTVDNTEHVSTPAVHALSHDRSEDDIGVVGCGNKNIEGEGSRGVENTVSAVPAT